MTDPVPTTPDPSVLLKARVLEANRKLGFADDAENKPFVEKDGTAYLRVPTAFANNPEGIKAAGDFARSLQGMLQNKPFLKAAQSPAPDFSAMVSADGKGLIINPQGFLDNGFLTALEDKKDAFNGALKAFDPRASHKGSDTPEPESGWRKALRQYGPMGFATLLGGGILLGGGLTIESALFAAVAMLLAVLFVPGLINMALGAEPDKDGNGRELARNHERDRTRLVSADGMDTSINTALNPQLVTFERGMDQLRKEGKTGHEWKAMPLTESDDRNIFAHMDKLQGGKANGYGTVMENIVLEAQKKHGYEAIGPNSRAMIIGVDDSAHTRTTVTRVVLGYEQEDPKTRQKTFHITHIASVQHGTCHFRACPAEINGKDGKGYAVDAMGKPTEAAKKDIEGAIRLLGAPRVVNRNVEADTDRTDARGAEIGGTVDPETVVRRTQEYLTRADYTEPTRKEPNLEDGMPVPPPMNGGQKPVSRGAAPTIV